MDYYFLEIKIEEFLYNSKESNIRREFNIQKNENIIKNKYMSFELIFELKESKEKFALQIINDKKRNKIPFTKNIILPTIININNKNFKNDFLNIYLYSNNSSIGEKHKLIDIDKGKLIDISCIQIKKYYNTKIGNFSIKKLILMIFLILMLIYSKKKKKKKKIIIQIIQKKVKKILLN